MPSQFQSISLAQASLAPPASVPERYAELWWYSGGACNVTSTTGGSYFMPKGATSAATSYSASQNKLITVNSSWPATTKFAMEITLYSSGPAVTAALWDMTTNTQVTGSQATVTSTTATVLRSGQFTLTPGHTYGVSIWIGTAGTGYATDASLIIFS